MKNSLLPVPPQPISPALPGRRLNQLADLISLAILLAASATGVLAFLYPFFSQIPPGEEQAGLVSHSQDAPILFAVLTVLLLGVVVSSLSSGRMNSKLVAVLGVLAAVSAVLRLVPGPGGFSALFFLPILAGYVYGPTFGFLLGALSLLASGLIGANMGPWLPFQMFASGWVGLLSGGLGRLFPATFRGGRWEVILLAIWGFGVGLLFGALMNLWFWPFATGGQQSELYWQPGVSLAETLRRYGLFYAVTSAWWDVGRAAGNSLLILLLGVPVLRVFRRFHQRFHFKRG